MLTTRCGMVPCREWRLNSTPRGMRMNEDDVRWPLRGPCLCGAITLEVDALAGPLLISHCRECHKSAGAAFIAVMPLLIGDFRVRDTLAALTSYRVTLHKARYFCACCGCPVYSARDGADSVRVRACGCIAAAA